MTSIALLISTLVFAPLLMGLAAMAAPEQPHQPAVQAVVQERGGLPHIFAKLKAGKSVTVAYIGGSITAGAGASDGSRTSYRALVGQWFAATFPQSAVNNVDAAIGGTGSDLGAFRAGRDVLAHHPDLVFVEFAVNDGGSPEAMIDRAMEGIVRQIHQADPTTDICFVYTFVVAQRDEVMRTAENGTTEDAPPRVHSTHQLVAGPGDQRRGGDNVDDGAGRSGRMEHPADGRSQEEDDQWRIRQLGDGHVAGPAVAEEPVDHRLLTMATCYLPGWGFHAPVPVTAFVSGAPRNDRWDHACPYRCSRAMMHP